MYFISFHSLPFFQTLPSHPPSKQSLSKNIRTMHIKSQGKCYKQILKDMLLNTRPYGLPRPQFLLTRNFLFLSHYRFNAFRDGGGCGDGSLDMVVCDRCKAVLTYKRRRRRGKENAGHWSSYMVSRRRWLFAEHGGDNTHKTTLMGVGPQVLMVVQKLQSP